MFRVIICNDNKPETDFIKELLAMEGYQVEVSQDIKELLHNIAFKSYQALILGVDIEGGKGGEIIPWIKAMDKELPIITIIEQDSLETQKKVRQQKVFYYFVRPINAEEMKTVMEGILLKSRNRKFVFQEGRLYRVCLNK
jgi:DNA-binding NtrC family response regulator